MDPSTDNGQSGWQTLASVLAGGFQGYVDSQNNQPVYVSQPLPQTAYGYAGTGQVTPTVAARAPAWLWLAGIGLVALIVFKKL